MAKKKGRPPSGIRVHEWDMNDANSTELDAHGLDLEIIEQVYEEAPRFRRNKKGHAASHLMIGPDRGGRVWAIAIVEIFPFRWRPITGWVARDHEKGWYDRSRGRSQWQNDDDESI